MSPPKRTALVLGAGFVSRPLVVTLAGEGVDVVVACRTLATAEALISGIPHTRAATVDVSSATSLDAAISLVDVVISLVPYTFHAGVVKAAIRAKKNVVTTSYISDALWALDAQAKAAGITVLNEIGLDPGIDHLYAIKVIDEVHRAGGKINSFISYCGGLPAPEASDNPLGYKFSWSSRGGLLALLNPGKYYEDGKTVDVPGKDLMAYAKPYNVYPGFNLVGYPNRDSTPFRKFYDLPEAQTIFRGTLRYSGFPEFVRLLVAIGFLAVDELPFLAAGNASPPTWAQASAQVLEAKSADESDIKAAIEAKFKFSSESEKARIFSGLKWIGVFSDKIVQPKGSILDTLCAELEEKMKYEEGERDIVILQHKFEIEHKDGQKETRTSTLVEYGEPFSPTSTSAMSKLVGLPGAVGTLAVLNGQITDKGMVAPWTTPAIAATLAAELKNKHGIEMHEKTLL